MGPRLLLGAAALLGATGVALLSPRTAGLPGDGSSSHSLRYYFTAVTESSPGLPRFLSVGYVDDSLFVHYDANSRKTEPRVPWIKKVEEISPPYWNLTTERQRNTEPVFRRNLATAQDRYNQSGGFHILQEMLGCELRKDGSKTGYIQFAYDGRDFISFDLETLTWTAADGAAQITKRKWEADSENSRYLKIYLELACIEWLQIYLEFRKEMLLRKEPPVGKVTHKAIGDGREALICQAYGFYPKEIKATWEKGEEVLENETFCRSIAPNSDGTYHIWLSIEIDPKERDLYQCHLDHASLPKPLVLAFEKPGADMGFIVKAILGVMEAVLMAVGNAFFT